MKGRKMILTDEEIAALRHLGGSIAPRAIESAVLAKLAAEPIPAKTLADMAMWLPENKQKLWDTFATAEPVATVNVFDPDGRGLKDWEFVGPITFYDLPHGKHLLYITPPAYLHNEKDAKHWNLLAVQRYQENCAQLEAMRLALDKLWIIVEHNKLHFGDAHNTVMAGIVAIAALEGAMK